MAALPTLPALTGASITEGEFKTALTALHEYLSGLLGTPGTPATAQAALGVLMGAGVVSKAVSYTVAPSDRGKILECDGTFTLTLPAAATAGAGFAVCVANIGSGSVTLNPADLETIGGAELLDVGPDQSVTIACTGLAWIVLGTPVKPLERQLRTEVFSGSGQWTCPPGVTEVLAVVIGGGAGGGGAKEVYAEVGNYWVQGASGGNGGMAVGKISVTPGTSYALTVGAGGAGTNTAGANGSSGATSSIFSLSAGGGSAGLSGTGSGGNIGNSNSSQNPPIFCGASSRPRAGGATAAVPWSATLGLVPGAGGLGEIDGANNAAGGVGGAVLIQYCG